MSEYGLAYANTLTQFKELDTETSEIAKNAISEIDPFKIENGKAIALSADEYRAQVEETVNAAQEMFGKGVGKTLLGIATDEDLNSENVAAVEQAQQNVVDYLRRTFGDNWYEDGNKMRVLIGLGFNLDDKGNILNIMNTLQSEFGVLQENGTKLSLSNLS